MHSLRKYIRVVSAFLLINFLYATFMPTISYALTSGPTAPEATSFEPIDTTDMVNPLTGDFTYNIPLLEVPGPSGGYPLSLSYHAGIMPNEEASWVGLGWTLNPGSITRTVNGYPDDHYAAERRVIDTWEGGSRSTFSLGIGLPGASYGLSFSQDTYQGFGIGASANFGVPFTFRGSGLGANLGLSVGSNGHGQFSAGPQVGLTLGKALGHTEAITGSVGLSTNFKLVSAGGGIGYKSGSANHSVLGVSLSSTDASPSFSAAGFSASQVNSNAGKVRTSSHGTSIPIPLATSGLFLNLGYNYTRYWSQEESVVDVFGALYPAWQDPDDNSYDSFTLLDPDAEGGIVENDEADKVLGGSMASFDSYSVNAQGLGGSMRPYALKTQKLYRQNVKKVDSEDYLINYGNLIAEDQNISKLQFRFSNDFSNRFSYDFDINEKPRIIGHAIVGTTTAGITPDYEEEGIDINKYHLAGSRNVEWVTNQEIKNGSAYNDHLLILNQDTSSWTVEKYEHDISKQVGAYIITNEKGVKYHYAQPVYSYEEVIYTSTDDSNGEVINKRIQSEPYAYTWYLTAVTGPDYVDKNTDGMLDEGDWGYWVKFDYGMWANNYSWRNPGVGTHRDLNTNFENFSYGKKELVYLNAISTKTHTALFVKEMRADAKGISKNGENSLFEISPIRKKSPCPNPCDVDYFQYPTSTLRLKSIYLIDNDQLTHSISDISNFSSEYNHSFSWTNEPVTVELDVHLGENVVDVKDIDSSPQDLKQLATRVIEMEHDNSLMPGTTNSFDLEGKIYAESPDTSDQDDLLGKLTLKSLSFLGKSNSEEDIIPPMTFGYDYENPMVSSLEEVHYSSTEKRITMVDSNFSYSDVEIGDLVKFQQDGVFYYGYVSLVFGLPENQVQIKVITDDSLLETGTIKSLQKTKNPPFNMDFEDMWGMYKSDYRNLGNENIDRIVSEISSKSKDVWSLRTVGNSLGADINIHYSSDKYLTRELAIQNLLNVTGVSVDGDFVKVELGIDSPDLGEILENRIMELQLMMSSLFKGDDSDCTCHCGSYGGLVDGDPWGYFWELEQVSLAYEDIQSISNNYFIIDNQSLFDLLTAEAIGSATYPENCNSQFGGEKKPEIYIDSPAFIAGSLVFPGAYEEVGGGIKVDRISISSSLGDRKSTKYAYSDGVTSYEPYGLGDIDLDIFISYKNSVAAVTSWDHELDRLEEIENAYKSVTYGAFSDLMANSRILPAPGVMYKNVTLSEDIQKGEEDPVKVNGEVLYEYQTFELAMAKREPINEIGIDSEWPARSLAFSDHTSAIGSLLSITHKDLNGNIISRTENDYLKTYEESGEQNPNSAYSNQGQVSEVFLENRFVVLEDDEVENQAILTLKEEFPFIQTGQTTINYKTGITTTTQNVAFDFYSGAVTKTRSTDGYGNTFESEIVPAYRVEGSPPPNANINGPWYPYAEMGLAINGGKNMLTQTGANYSWKVDPSNGGIQALIAAEVQTWSNRWAYRSPSGSWDNIDPSSDPYPVWRKHKAYTYTAGANNKWVDDINVNDNTNDGLMAYSSGDFEVFDAWNYDDDDEPGSKWQKNSEITLYDRYSHALEAKDVNGNFAATKMDSQQEKVLATVANASYDEFAYSGAEDSDTNGYFGGVVAKDANASIYTTGAVPDPNVHTGKASLSATAGNKAYGFKVTASQSRNMKVSVWASQGDGEIKYKINDGTEQSITPTSKASGSWHLLTAYLPALNTGDKLEVWCAAGNTTTYFDDFRVHPIDAPMTAYVYNEFDELAFVLDNNNLYTEYQYDDMGRLKSTYRESFKYGRKKVSEYEIKYAKHNN